MRTRVLVVLACLGGFAAMPSIDVGLPVVPPEASPGARGCEPHLVGPTGDVRAMDPATLGPRGPVVTLAERAHTREARLGGGNWSHATAIQVFERRGTVSSIRSYEASIDAWYVSLATPPLPRHPACDSERADDTVYALLATGGRPVNVPATNLPSFGAATANVQLTALSIDGAGVWRAAVPARAGYYREQVTFEFAALRPALAISADGRTLAVVHSEFDGSDHISLVDVGTREVRTQPLRDDRATIRLGPAIADAKVVERRKAWSPRFLDDRYLYAVLHETRTDELGELSVLLIDTTDARIVARWPERGVMNTVRATLADWTVASGSVYLTGRDWSQHPYTLYRLDARDLRLRVQRSFDLFPLIQVGPPTS